MPLFMGKCRPHVVIYEFLCQRYADNACSQDQHIHVVMLYALVG